MGTSKFTDRRFAKRVHRPPRVGSHKAFSEPAPHVEQDGEARVWPRDEDAYARVQQASKGRIWDHRRPVMDTTKERTWTKRLLRWFAKTSSTLRRGAPR